MPKNDTWTCRGCRAEFPTEAAIDQHLLRDCRRTGFRTQAERFREIASDPLLDGSGPWRGPSRITR